MGGAGFDDLEFARQQLHLAVSELSGSEMTPQDRVQLGLLAAQVAICDRLSALLPDDAVTEAPPAEHPPAADRVAVVDELAPAAGKVSADTRWTPALCERILRSSSPAGHRLVRALLAEGGSASVDRLTELTGDTTLRAATLSLNTAARREGAARVLPERRLIQAHRYPHPLTSKVTAYSLPAETIPSFTTAVEILGELHRRLYEPPAS